MSGRSSLAVRLLGPVEADVDGAPADLGSPKQRGLLALLAIEPGRVVSAERLIGELWGDDAADSSLSTLQVYVSRLRRALGPDQGTGDPVVVRRAPGYVLDVPPQAVDTQAFDRLLTAATEKADLAPREAMTLVDEALALVRGPVLGDVVDRLGDVARTEAQRLEERVLSARELRLELLLASGEAASAATAAAALAAELPLRESVHAILVLALYRSGRQAEALACYDQVRTRLADELGVDPGPELRHLHAQVLRHDPALAAPGPEPAAPDTPPAAVRREQPPLIGRDVELEQLLTAAADARDGHGGLVAVIGEAGIGKTRLVRELADRCAADGMLVAWGATPEGALAHALLHLRQQERSAALAADTLTRATGLPAAAVSVELTIAPRGDPRRPRRPARYAEKGSVRARERGSDVVVVLAGFVFGWTEARRTRIPAARADALARLRSASTGRRTASSWRL